MREGKGHSEGESAIGDRGPTGSSEACDRHRGGGCFCPRSISLSALLQSFPLPASFPPSLPFFPPSNFLPPSLSRSLLPSLEVRQYNYGSRLEIHAMYRSCRSITNHRGELCADNGHGFPSKYSKPTPYMTEVNYLVLADRCSRSRVFRCSANPPLFSLALMDSSTSNGFLCLLGW